MAKTDNLTDFLVDLADGIRAKKGTTDPINPQDFRAEIESIEGGGSGGGQNYIYYNQKKVIINIRSLWEESSSIKLTIDGQTLIAKTTDALYMIKENGLEESIIAVCIDPNLKIQYDPTEPLRTWAELNPKILEYVNEGRITEEEYFNLNA